MTHLLQMDLLTRWRHETAQEHEAIEKALDLQRTGLTKEGYRALLARFYGFYAPFEEILFAQRAESRAAQFYLQGREKLSHLTHDLLALGMSAEEIRALPRTTFPADWTALGEALWGVLYVIEGSTLGGQVLQRHFKTHIGVTPERGLAFFAGYGPETGSQWKAFLAKVASLDLNREQTEATVQRALETFRRLSAWLTLA